MTQCVRIQAQNTEPPSPLRLAPDGFHYILTGSRLVLVTQRQGLPLIWAWRLRNEKQSTWEPWGREFSKDSFPFDRVINFLKRPHLEGVSGVSPSTTEKRIDHGQV